MKILIVHHHPFELWRAPAWMQQRLSQAFPNLRVMQMPNYDRVPQEITDTDILIGSWLSPEQLATARKLKWIHSPAAAVHQLMYPAMISNDVVITSAREVHGPVVAEHALALVLALAKRLPQAMQYQARKQWAQQTLWDERPRPREISGGTVAVVGMGSIGREFIARAKALGMRVLAVRDNPQKGMGGADAVYASAQLDEVLPQADYVLLCAPVTPATTGMINHARLARMKPDAYLLNVGRGDLVDEPALLQALQQRVIAGAALDVFAHEPLPKESPLWTLDNLFITPHTAAVTEKLWNRHYEMIRENLERFLQGRPLLHEVNKRGGY
ncbi:MAG TPA: D-2-hydroxyacid dehydrogenase [Candidatus Saccharimonadales bacterium]|jgi:phosphoglycerate dehydrogenase-like enzyme|nr:D-2-hydroxyacid dehydrogenase [Candidatus Saccharimonadales bacterium]